jgi:hypothetical protein
LPTPPPTPKLPAPRARRAAAPAISSGSGFVYHIGPGHAWLLTNAHVVSPPPAAVAPPNGGAPLLARAAAAPGWLRRAGGGGRAAATACAAPGAGAAASSGTGGAGAPPSPPAPPHRVLVHTADGRVFEGAVAALDRPADLAVVRIGLEGGGAGAAAGPEALAPARLGSSAGCGPRGRARERRRGVPRPPWAHPAPPRLD